MVDEAARSGSIAALASSAEGEATASSCEEKEEGPTRSTNGTELGEPPVVGFAAGPSKGEASAVPRIVADATPKSVLSSLGLDLADVRGDSGEWWLSSALPTARSVSKASAC
jgi:hypothetical protein